MEGQSEKRRWIDHVKDDKFIRNLIIVGMTGFVLIGLILLYMTRQLDVSHFKSSIDIALGIAIGTGLLKLLSYKKNGKN